MTLAYQALVSYEEDNWDDYLNKICLIDIFKPLFQVVQNDEVKNAIRYIVWAYSLDSDMLIIGQDWNDNKVKIFKKSKLKDEYADSFINLKDEIVVNVINRWLDFQDSDTFTQLMVFKDLKREMQISAVNIIRKSSGEIDYDQKHKNAIYAHELTKKIKDLEMELIQNSIKLKDAVYEVKTQKNQKNTLTPEMFAK